MHDLLERLGREIVRKQSIHDPGQRQFLVDARDICKVLNNDTLSRGIVIGAIINVSEIEDDLNICDSALESMSCLQFLRLRDHRRDPYDNSYLPQNLNNLPRKVRLLDWQFFPKTCLPSNFNPEFLVELNMSHSKLVKLWGGKKTIRKLKWMDLSFSKKLRELPDLSTATNLCQLNLSWCSNLVKLPCSIGNAINLQILDLRSCSSLIKLPSSIGNAINLQRLDLSYCLNLVKLPSSIGNATNLSILDLSRCSRLVELPSSIGNATNLSILDLSRWPSLVKLPSSIGNLHKLSVLRLKGCSKLGAIPININMEFPLELDLTDCLLLKKFPKIFTNIETEVEEILPRPRLELCVSYWEHLGEFSHSFKYITELHLSDKRIQEISQWIKELSRLRELVIKGFTKLVSLPQLPDSLELLYAENCGSLETSHCSFQNNKFIRLNFVNCFKLSQEASDFIVIKASSCEFAILPGEKVPTHYTYQATESSLSMKLDGNDMHFPTLLRFQACVLLVNKGDVEIGNFDLLYVDYGIKAKQNGVNVTCSSANTNLSTRLKKYMFMFQREAEKLPRLSNSSSELVIEFEVKYKKLEIEECGIEECPKAY